MNLHYYTMNKNAVAPSAALTKYMCGVSILLLMLFSANAFGQDCGCDHWIRPTDVTDNSAKIIDWDAGPTARNVQPGQTICIEATTFLYSIRIKNVNGTSTSRITIKNCGGQAIIDNKNNGTGDNGYHALDITGSEYFNLRGDGDPNEEYGIKVQASNGHGLSIAGFSTEFEVQNLEISNTDGCGINSKTDPSCSNRDLRSFTQRNSWFHNNYLHDIGDEGMYVGYTHYPTNTYVTCNGASAVFYGHPMENIRIYDNLLERIGWDAIQVGALATGNQIYGNTIKDYATLDNGVHIHAIQLSDGGDQCDVFGNRIMPSGTGLAGVGSAVASWTNRTKIYNNLFVNTGRDNNTEGSGFVAVQIYDDNDGLNDGEFYVMNNTIINPGRGGVSMFNTGANGRINNNIIIQPNGQYVTAAPSNTNRSNNYEATSTSGAGFTGEYHLSSSSPSTILDAGLNLYSLGVTTDFDGQSRPSSGPFDIGFDEFGEVPAENRLIKINFRGTTPSYTNAEWNDWNTTPTTASAPFSDLKYTDGESSNYALTITTSFSGANGLGMTGTGVYPSEVMQTNWYVHNNTTNPGVFSLSGLDNNKVYSFRFFGSREDATGTTNRNTDYTIGSTTVSLNASNNTTETVSIENVSPVNGNVSISVKYGTGATFGYLNAMEITEVPVAVVKNVKVNFRGTTPAFSDPAWNDWNTTPTTASAPFTNLKYADGSSSNFGMAITTSFSGANGLGMSGTGIYPSEVMQTNWYVHNNTTNPGVFVLTGLNDNNTYTFRFFGSREDATGTTNRNTDYTIGVTTVTLNASNNTTQTVDIEDVSPTDGEIVISVKYGTGATFGYLNAMEIFETSGSGSSMSSMTQAEQFSQPEEHEFVSIYPVPFKDKITITFKEQVDGEVSVSLVGMEGREYFHNEGYVIDQEQPLQIDLSGSNIPRGVYLLKVQSTSGMQSKMRIVKE
jgi:hypothetical protein